jgi:hypothetical protein
MRQYSDLTDISVMPRDLIAFAWSAPLRDLAAQVGLSDVGLKKQLVSYGIPLPRQGYWNKIKAGKKVPAMPEPGPRKPGQSIIMRVDHRFEGIIAVAAPMTSEGPFASDLVPDDLDDLLKLELQAIGTVKVPKMLGYAPPGLHDVLRQEEKRRVRFAQNRWSRGPLFDSPVSQRQLKIWSTLYSTLVKRGHAGQAYEHEGQLMCQVSIGDTRIGVELGVLGSSSRRGDRTTDNLPVTTPLTLRISPLFDGRSDISWQDDKDGTLEEKIGTIAALTIVAGEKAFRRRLKETKVQADQEIARQDEQRRQRKQALNDQRLEKLRESGDLLRQSRNIRHLVGEVRQAMELGTHDIDPLQIALWEQWALGEADRLDPILSGQFKSHVIEPTLDD